MFLKPAIIEEAEEFDAREREGDGGGKREAVETAKPMLDCERLRGLVSSTGFTGTAERIFRCACSKLMGFVGDGLSGTERTDAAWYDSVPNGRLAFPGL